MIKIISKEVIRDCFNLLEAEYGKQTDQKKELWSKMFKDHTDEELKEAVIKHIKRGEFFPRISNIIEMIEGSQEDEPEFAWIYLREKIEGKGYYQSVSFPKYPAVGAVIEAMAEDWCKFIEMLTASEEKWIKKEFIKIYPIMKRRGNYPARLIGRFELDNSNKGYSEEYMLERYGRLLDGSKIERKKLKGEVNE
ncbi:hypothetical protein ES705_26108 [subsurface metagenome]